LLWPLTFLLFSRKTRHLILGLAVVIVAIWIHRGHLWMSTHATYYITYAFDTRADALLVGCLLALALKEGLGQWVLERICRPVWAPLLTCLLIGISVYSGGVSEGYKLVGGLAIEPVLVAILISQLIVQSASRPWKWLNSKPAVYLGRISYPLYLYHMLATHLAIRIAAHIPGRNTGLFVIIAVFTAIAIASCSYYIVEKPFLALKVKGSAAVPAAKIPVASRQEKVRGSRPTTITAS
jgi:peptidoglycan/LPS O-acetylase OafA/YrhL